MEKKIAGPKNGKLYTEDDWNDEATIDKFPYHLSKTLAEQRAWELAEQFKFDLVSINPVMMLGPVVSAYGTSNSIMEMKLALEGKVRRLPTVRPRQASSRLLHAHALLHDLDQRRCTSFLPGSGPDNGADCIACVT